MYNVDSELDTLYMYIHVGQHCASRISKCNFQFNQHILHYGHPITLDFESTSAIAEWPNCTVKLFVTMPQSTCMYAKFCVRLLLSAKNYHSYEGSCFAFST